MDSIEVYTRTTLQTGGVPNGFNGSIHKNNITDWWSPKWIRCGIFMSSNKDKAGASTTKKESTITKVFTTQDYIYKDIAEQSNGRYRKSGNFGVG